MRPAVHAGQLLQPVPGGIGRYVRRLLEQLPGAGADTTAFAAGARPAGVPDAVRWVDLGRPRGRWRYRLWQLAPRRELPVPGDVVHAPSLAIPCGRDRPLVVTVHDLAWRRFPEAFTRRGRRFHDRGFATTREHASRIITASAFGRAELVREGIEPSRIDVIPHGADRPPALPAARIDARVAAAGLQAPFVLSVGTIEPRKNLPALVDAIGELRSRRPDVTLAIVGPRGWGQVRGLEQPGVRLLGRVSEETLDALYRRAAVCCQPSRYEGFGFPALEAMARGCPVVAGTGGALAEVVGDGGTLVDVGDPTAIALVLDEILGDPDGRATLVARARARAARFTWEASAVRHLGVYQAALDPRA